MIHALGPFCWDRQATEVVVAFTDFTDHPSKKLGFVHVTCITYFSVLALLLACICMHACEHCLRRGRVDKRTVEPCGAAARPRVTR